MDEEDQAVPAFSHIDSLLTELGQRVLRFRIPAPSLPPDIGVRYMRLALPLGVT